MLSNIKYILNQCMFNLFFYLYNILFKRELTVCYTLLSCKVSGYVETRLTLDFLQLSVKVWFTFKFFPINAHVCDIYTLIFNVAKNWEEEQTSLRLFLIPSILLKFFDGQDVTWKQFLVICTSFCNKNWYPCLDLNITIMAILWI